MQLDGAISNRPTLDLAERTIKYHMGEIVARFHLQNRAQVVEYARRTG